MIARTRSAWCCPVSASSPNMSSSASGSGRSAGLERSASFAGSRREQQVVTARPGAARFGRDPGMARSVSGGAPPPSRGRREPARTGCGPSPARCGRQPGQLSSATARGVPVASDRTVSDGLSGVTRSRSLPGPLHRHSDKEELRGSSPPPPSSQTCSLAPCPLTPQRRSSALAQREKELQRFTMALGK
jgi:hypothetical protein